MVSEKEKTSKIQILDCTLRDGGYYNNWDFNVELVKDHLNALEQSGVDIAEIGFRSTKNNIYKGPLAFTTENFLENLDFNNLSIAVMVNAKEFENKKDSIDKIKKLFPFESKNSKIDIVRLACNSDEVPTIINACETLISKGYKVCLNIMQGAQLDFNSIELISKHINELSISAVYIADSTGSMLTEEYNQKLFFLSERINCDIGIHSHNNLGRALENTLNSLNIGCKWLDATIFGMGRGPGNTDIEELLISLIPKYKTNLNLIPIINHAEKWFIDLKRKYKWGKNRYYFLSGMYKIHPSYVQDMLSDERYSSSEIIGAIDYLRKEDAKIYESEKLLKARVFFQGSPRGANNPNEIIKNKEILLLGNSPGIINYRKNIEKLIEEKSLYVVGLNSISNINPKLIDARVFCHPMRLLADNNLFHSIDQLVITPFSMLPDKLKFKLKSNVILDYGIKIKEAAMKSHENFCTIPFPIALAYALATLGASDVETLILAGFEGYKKGDERNTEVEKTLSIFNKNYPKINIYSITPSNYLNLNSKSIYGLD